MGIRRSRFILFSWVDWAIAFYPPVELRRSDDYHKLNGEGLLRSVSSGEISDILIKYGDLWSEALPDYCTTVISGSH